MKIKTVNLGKRTCAGREGFTYAIELNTNWKHWNQSLELQKKIRKLMGRDFQKHWSRRQLNRRWYTYTLDYTNTTRICFRTERDRTLAMML